MLVEQAVVAEAGVAAVEVVVEVVVEAGVVVLVEAGVVE